MNLKKRNYYPGLSVGLPPAGMRVELQRPRPTGWWEISPQVFRIATARMPSRLERWCVRRCFGWTWLPDDPLDETHE